MIGFGTKDNTPKDVISESIKCGYTLIDTKDSNKSIEHFKNIIFNRNNIMLCSKLMGENSYENHNPNNVILECKKSLEKGNLNYWDIYYIHTTYSFGNYSVLDTFNEIINLKKIGLIKNTGLSNITFDQLYTFILNDKKPDYIQIEIHPYLIEEDIVELCKKYKIKIICHSPFGSQKFIKKIANEPILISLSKKYNKSIYQIILKWHINRNIIPIPSSNNKININQNLDLEFYMSQNDLNIINNLNKNARAFIKPNHFEYIFKETSGLKMINKTPLNNTSNIHTKIVNEIISNGYFVSKVSVIDNELFKIVKNIQLENINIQSIKKKLFDREFQIDLTDKFNCDIKSNLFIKKIAEIYFNTTSFKICHYITYNTLSKHLLRSKTQLFHKDIQTDSLKILIYLNDIHEFNGCLELVETENDNLKWYSEKKFKCPPRTTLNEIIKNDMKINKIIGEKFTFVIFNGRKTHSGGYIQKGFRFAIYIEIIKN